MKSLSRTQIIVLVGLIFLGAALRLLPHPANFSPVMAMAVFAGVFLGRGRMITWLVPLAALFLSDLVLGFYAAVPFVYGAMVLGVGIGQFLSPRFEKNLTSNSQATSLAQKLARLFGLTTTAALAGSLVFFVISNFGVWFEGQLYPLNFSGMIECYIAALPFLFKSLVGDLAYTYILFGAWVTLRESVPTLAEVSSRG